MARYLMQLGTDQHNLWDRLVDSDTNDHFQAVKSNPFAPNVPCHRVVAANGEIGGYSGTKNRDDTRLSIKRAMLASEAVKFINDYTVSSDSIMTVDELKKAIEAGREGGEMQLQATQQVQALWEKLNK